jgi:pimeloyl-ACP methyl ester carboxylesterase
MGFSAWQAATVDRLNAGSTVIQTEGGAVEYALVGTGPAVLVIHGSPGGYDQGLLLVRCLDDPQFRFIAVSRPGYLRTPLETGRSPEDQADAMAAFLDVLRLRQVSVIAVSGGGPSALQFALRHPGRCSSLVLISARTQRLPRVPLGLRVLDSVLGCSDAVGWLFNGLAGRLRGRHSADENLRMEFAQTLFPYSLRRAGRSNDTFNFLHMTEYPLSEIRQPALVIHGTADRIVPFSNAEFAAVTIPNAQLIRIPGAGHLVPLEQDLRIQISDFLKAAAPTAVSGAAG